MNGWGRSLGAARKQEGLGSPAVQESREGRRGGVAATLTREPETPPSAVHIEDLSNKSETQNPPLSLAVGEGLP